MKYRGFTLDSFQERSIGALDAGRSVLVCAPTGTGKTVIADWIVEKALGEGRRVIYTAPIKALSNQKFRDYCRLHGEENVGLVTGDLVIRRDANCVVMTTEILRNMLLSGDKLSNLRAVIVDEIHFLDDRERGTVWEEVLIYLPQHVQIVGLSATLSNQEEFSEWLSEVRGSPVDVVTETVRAVPLQLLYLSRDTGLQTPEGYEKKWKQRPQDAAFRQGKPNRRGGRNQRRGGDRGGRKRPKRKTTHLDVFDALNERDLLPYLYFVFSRRDTELLARALGRHVGHSLIDNPEDQRRLDALMDQAAGDLGPALEPEIRALYSNGIAFHHAGLHVQLKALVESLYEAKLIKALYCTSTFALGINMPARTTVFDGLKKYDGRTFAPLTTRQFMQKAGRAGRRGLDDVGHVVLRMDFEEFDEAKAQLKRYASGKSEPVRSTFNLSWNSIVNLVGRHSLARAREVVEKSFLQWHLVHRAEQHIQRASHLSDSARKKDRKEAGRLVKRARKEEARCWGDFEQRLGYLVDCGYVSDDLGFNAGGKVLQHLQISEILVTELVLSGEVETLNKAQLFGVVCAITNELPRRVERNFSPTSEDKRIFQWLKRVRYSDIVMDAEMMTGVNQDLDPDLIVLGRLWAEGDDLQTLLMKIHSDTDVSGDLITGFRRAKDLVGQLREVYRDIPEMYDMLGDLIRIVRRDEVEVVD
jgi:superfamily II RNA helicase